MTARAVFKQSDLERIFKAAKKADVRVAARIKPTGEIEAQMLTEGEEAEQGPSPLRRKVFGASKA
jgi:hypothetical protein